MEEKIILLATFTEAPFLNNFLFKVYKKFGVKKKSIFLFETEDGGLILTYKVSLNQEQKLNIKNELPKTVQIHKKGTTFFTINSLNKLIEKEFDLETGNVNHSKYNIDWSKFENCMISLKNNNLEILQLKKKILE